MKQVLRHLSQMLYQRIVLFGLILFMGISGFWALLEQPSYAAAPFASDRVNPQEQIDRAYEYGTDTGIREEEYQKRISQGENPEKMPKPYKRFTKDNQETPKTSLVEEAANKTEQLIHSVKGQK